MDFSIVIVTYNRKKHLEKCLSSIKACAPTSHKYEVIVIFNGETSYLNAIRSRYPDFQTFYIPTSTPAAARNYAATKAKGNYLFFLDDDCFLPADYFSHVSFEENWDALGGPDQTPPDASDFQKTLGLALSSPLCTGKTFKRHTSTSKSVLKGSDESHLILCNLWMKRSLFSTEGYQFPVDLFRNEENYLLKELRTAGKKILYNSRMYVYHNRKEDIVSLSRAVIKSGECRFKSFTKLPEKSEAIYFLPSAFLIFFLYWLFNPFSFFGYAFILYTLAVILYMGLVQKTFSVKVIFLHYFIVLFYAIGLLNGLKLMLEKKLPRNYNQAL